MKLRNLARSLAVGLAALAGMSLAFATGVASADKLVRAKQAVLVSDDITKNTTDVLHAAGVSGGTVPGAASDVSKAGFADDSNPNQGGGTVNAKVGGTDNPNKAK